MSETKKRRKLDKRPIAYCVLSFFMAAFLFLLSICISLRFTLLSNDYMLSTMADSEYYTQVTEEFRQNLESLGHASGLNSEFTNNFVQSMDIRQDVIDYINAFYTGQSTVVNKTPFKQKFRAAIDQYAEENKKEGQEPSEKALEYLTNEAATIYADCIQIPFFAVIANFIYKLTTPMNITIAVLALLCAVIVVIIYFTNSEFRHRTYRYLSYAFSGAFLCTIVLPAYMHFSGIISKVSINSRSLYNLFVSYFDGMFRYMWIFALAYLVLGVLFFAAFASKHKRLVNNH